jgi:hypothetical protein
MESAPLSIPGGAGGGPGGLSQSVTSGSGDGSAPSAGTGGLTAR